DDDVHAVLVLVDDDRRDVGRRQRTDDELRRIVGPEDDVDALAAEFPGDGLHARTAHTDAGADRVDTAVVRVHGDLRAYAGVARRRLDLEQPLLDLGHFVGEQVLDEFGRGAREEQLRAAALAIDLLDVGAHPVADAQVLLLDHLVARQARFELARFDDRALAVDPLDGPGQDRFAAREKVVDDLLALGVADLLEDHLLGGLCADPAQFDRLELFLDVVADLHVGHLLLRLGQDDLQVVVLEFAVGNDLPAPVRLVVARHPVDRDAHVALFLEALLGCRGERAFECAEHDLASDVLFTGQRVDQQQNFATHPGTP